MKREDVKTWLTEEELALLREQNDDIFTVLETLAIARKALNEAENYDGMSCAACHGRVTVSGVDREDGRDLFAHRFLLDRDVDDDDIDTEDMCPLATMPRGAAP